MSVAKKLEAELIDLGKIEKPKPKKAKESATPKGDSVFDLANACPIADVMVWLGQVEADGQPICPGCRESDQGVAYVKNGLKCSHDRCKSKGVDVKGATRGFRTPIDVVMEVRSLEALDAAYTICERFGIEVPKREQAANETSGNSCGKWEQPIPLDTIGPLPAFPVHCLPPVLRDFVAAEAEATQTPVELAACVVLGVLSACAAGSYEVEVRPGYVEPIQVYTMASMGPGERKSSVFADATRPIRDYERERAVEMAPAIQRAAARRKILELRYQEALKRAAKTGDGLDAALVDELAIELAEHEIPTVPRLIADDTTPERLATLLSENGGRMSVMSAEGGLFETFAGRYSDGVANIDVLLKGHAGDMLRVDRQNRPPVILDRPVVTLALCVQPDVLQGLACKPSFRGRGLLARFLYALPESKMGRRLVVAPPVPRSVKDAYHAMCTRLLASRRDEPEILRFAPASQAALDAFQAELEPRLGPDGDLASIRDWAAKLVGATVRISALLHLAERYSVNSGNCAEGSAGLADTGNTADSICEKKEIALFFLSHSLAAFGLMGSDKAQADAQRALTWLRAPRNRHNRQNSVSKRDLGRALTLKPAEVDAMISVLTEHRFIRSKPQEQRQGAGRPPSPEYEINPLWKT